MCARDVDEPRSLGIVSATRGYLDLSPWETIIDEPSKPVVAANLLAGRYDAGLTHVHHAAEHPDRLRLEAYYGAVDTTWVVYGARKRFRGEVIGQRNPWLFDADPQPHGVSLLAPARRARARRGSREPRASRQRRQ